MIGIPHKQLLFEPAEQVAGFALCLAVFDLWSGCRVEPDLFSVNGSYQLKVISQGDCEYIEAIQISLDAVSDQFRGGALICAVAYQGNDVSGDGSEKKIIMLRLFWPCGDEALISLPWQAEAGEMVSIGRPEFYSLSGRPDLQTLEAATWAGLSLFEKGRGLWDSLGTTSKLRLQ